MITATELRALTQGLREGALSTESAAEALANAADRIDQLNELLDLMGEELSIRIERLDHVNCQLVMAVRLLHEMQRLRTHDAYFREAIHSRPLVRAAAWIQRWVLP